jgi:hypothetical protein
MDAVTRCLAEHPWQSPHLQRHLPEHAQGRCANCALSSSLLLQPPTSFLLFILHILNDLAQPCPESDICVICAVAATSQLSPKTSRRARLLPPQHSVRDHHQEKPLPLPLPLSLQTVHSGWSPLTKAPPWTTHPPSPSSCTSRVPKQHTKQQPGHGHETQHHTIKEKARNSLKGWTMPPENRSRGVQIYPGVRTCWPRRGCRRGQVCEGQEP